MTPVKRPLTYSNLEQYMAGYPRQHSGNLCHLLLNLGWLLFVALRGSLGTTCLKHSDELVLINSLETQLLNFLESENSIC